MLSRQCDLRIQIYKNGLVMQFSSDFQVRDVGHPHPVRRRHCKVAIKQVGRHGLVVL